MASTALSNTLIKIFIMVMFGFILKKKGIIDDGFQKNISALLINAIFPINILSSANATFEKGMSEKLIQSTIISASYYILAIIIMTVLSKYLLTEKKKRNIFITMSVFANTGFIGFPIVGAIYGSEGMLYAIIYNLFYQLFFFTYGVKLLSG